MATTSIAPAARSIPGHSRLTGELVALVPSCSQPNVYHVTTATRCSCKGYQFRGRCRHLSPLAPSSPLVDGGAAHLAAKRAAGEWPALSAETRAAAAKYTEIFGADSDQ